MGKQPFSSQLLHSLSDLRLEYNHKCYDDIIDGCIYQPHYRVQLEKNRQQIKCHQYGNSFQKGPGLPVSEPKYNLVYHYRKDNNLHNIGDAYASGNLIQSIAPKRF